MGCHIGKLAPCDSTCANRTWTVPSFWGSWKMYLLVLHALCVRPRPHQVLSLVAMYQYCQISWLSVLFSAPDTVQGIQCHWYIPFSPLYLAAQFVRGRFSLGSRNQWRLHFYPISCCFFITLSPGKKRMFGLTMGSLPFLLSFLSYQNREPKQSEDGRVVTPISSWIVAVEGSDASEIYQLYKDLNNFNVSWFFTFGR